MTAASQGKRTVTTDQMNRLAAWSMRKPVIALMGDADAGRLPLMNLLIDDVKLPEGMATSTWPPIWLRHGTAAPYRVDQDGQRHVVDLDHPEDIPVRETRFLRLYAPAEILKTCDLIDTPDLSAPDLDPRDWIMAVGYANAVMWCIPADADWSEQDRALWLSLPQRLRSASILVVTAGDVNELDGSAGQGVGTLFESRVVISPTDAARGRDSADADLWSSSGGERFAGLLDDLVDRIGVDRASALSRYEIEDDGETPPLAGMKTMVIGDGDIDTLMQDAPSGLVGSDSALVADTHGFTPLSGMKGVEAGSVEAELAATRELRATVDPRMTPRLATALDGLISIFVNRLQKRSGKSADTLH